MALTRLFTTALPAANSTVNGAITTGSQTFAGDKTFAASNIAIGGSNALCVFSIGEDPTLTTNTTSGVRWQNWTNGWLYNDYKTWTDGRIVFRSGHGTEAGFARNFMQVYANTGAIVFTHTISERSRTVPLGEWQSYTPVLTASSVNPTNIVVTGRYTIIGKTVHFWVRMGWTSISTNGTGWFLISLPVTAYASAQINGTVLFYDDSTGGRRGGTMDLSDTTKIFLIDCDLGLVSGTNPITFTDNDVVLIRGSYEIA